MKNKLIASISLFIVVALLTGCSITLPADTPTDEPAGTSNDSLPEGDVQDSMNEPGESPEVTQTDAEQPIDPEPPTDAEPAEPQEDEDDGIPVVYFTEIITPESLVAIYEALGAEPTGNIAIKIHTGEPPNSNYLRPELIGDLVRLIGGTLVETNTVGGQRASTDRHMRVARNHGFVDLAPFELLDADGEISLPITVGEVLDEVVVGASFPNYDYYVVISHFKGHGSAGFGGAIKNLSIGIASAAGKSLIHSGGARRTGWSGDQDAFLKGMAEAATAIADYLDGNVLYINVMNRLSVDCDCLGNPAEPDMHDIGVLASLDPVALDQACVDLVYAADDGASLIGRIEARNGILTLVHSEAIGLGSRTYRLVNID